jgi:hypothetical protein
LAALHLIIETDRLTGGHTREQIVDELVGLIAFEHPRDPAERHREIAEAAVDLLANARDRHTRLRDRYLRVGPDGSVSHPDQSFHLVRVVSADETAEPTLRATPEAINIFQNLFEFDPSDRAAAERYRSERMLERHDYDEVLSSVERRATSIHGLRGELDRLLRRLTYNVRDVDYAAQVIPLLDEAVALVREQIDAEERFANTVAEHIHHRAPDLPRLQRITDHLQALIRALTALLRTATVVRKRFEEEQDRQLFTYRRVTINPQSELLQPLLAVTPQELVELLQAPLAVWLGPRRPCVPNLQAVIDRTVPTRRPPTTTQSMDPFDLGGLRGRNDELDPMLLAAVTRVLGEVTAPTSLSELLGRLADAPGIDRLQVSQRALLPWALAVTVASAYGVTDPDEPRSSSEGFDHSRLAVVWNGGRLNGGPVAGDDLLIIPHDNQAIQG